MDIHVSLLSDAYLPDFAHASLPYTPDPQYPSPLMTTTTLTIFCFLASRWRYHVIYTVLSTPSLLAPC
jgi:hypothetical protein